MTDADDTFVAVDLGGTLVRAGRYTAAGGQLARAERATPEGGKSHDVVACILSAVRAVAMQGAPDVRAVGIGAPGPLDPFSGTIIRAPNIPGLEDFPLADALRDALALPVFLGNDANVAALGEWKYGAARGYRDVLYLTISTGIGSGVIADGRLLLGAAGMAAELGHTMVARDGPVCACGQRGHLEALASGTAIARTARARLRAGADSRIAAFVDGDISRVTAEHVGVAAVQGDELARHLLCEAGTYIGSALASFLHAFNPAIVVIGGGVAKAGDLLLEPVRAEMRRRVMTDRYVCEVVPAQLGADVGLLGALALATQGYYRGPDS